MKRILRILLAALLLAALCALLSGCEKSKAPAGRYTAVNPPVESGETVIEALEFSGGKVTMSSGNTVQTVDYKMENGTFSIHTKFGDFSYSCSQEEDGSLIIDGVRYRPE